MSKSSLNLNRNSVNERSSSSLSLERSAEVDGVLNELLTIELVGTLRASTEMQMRRDEQEMSEEAVEEELMSKLKGVGASIGRSVTERIRQGRGPFDSDLEVIKLLCKEIWTFLYGKQLDNLRTNHKYLCTQVGILQGCLSAFDLQSEISYDLNALPGCTFQYGQQMSASQEKLQSTSWADDVDETIAAPEPQIQTITSPDSDIITTIEVRTLPDGKRVQVTRKFRKVLKKSNVNHSVAERKNWPKFGLEKGKPAGPDRATTTVGENVVLKLSAGNKAAVDEPSEEQLMKERLKSKKIVCRLCKGDHFTTKCPYKSTLGDLDSAQDSTQTPDESNANQGTATAASTTGKYIPPSQRAGARASGAGPGAPSRDEYPTLRVTNVSEDTQEEDLKDLFKRFGRVQRVFIGRDRETRASKGFAFVSFEMRSDAEKALEKVNGMGYDNLILSVQWSQPRDK
ncbi:hypothetical protein E3P99_02829 [Wallemia hederae]|uniref:Eukaryotic translation initiation factor 3 subunit G n=1 Tax=Wallemia hederae TaxID=1540922 RepID=A0A4T0FIA9_9BASI|nr:hypothetical protein E3P99_02829 [Wallemia hederae]